MGLLKDNVIVYSYEESLKPTSFSFFFFFVVIVYAVLDIASTVVVIIARSSDWGRASRSASCRYVDDVTGNKLIWAET